MHEEIKLKVNLTTILQNLNVLAPIIILVCVGLITAGWIVLSFLGYTNMECSMDNLDDYIQGALVATVSLFLIFTILIFKGFKYANKKIILCEDSLILINQKKQYSIPYQFIKAINIDKSLFHFIGLKRNLLITLKSSSEHNFKKGIFICSERALNYPEITIEQLKQAIENRIEKL